MNQDKKRNLEFKINMVNRVSRVLSNMVILLFIYFSLLGDVGKVTSEYYLKNNISMYEIIRNVIIVGSIAYIFYLAIRYIFYKRFKLEIMDLLALYLSSLAGINYMFYFSETNNYIGIYILAVGLLISIIKRILILFLEKKINNKEI